MGTSFNNSDTKALGDDGSYEKLVAEVGEIVSKDDDMELFLQLLKERISLDYNINRKMILNGVKAGQDQQALSSWRSSARDRASRVLPFLTGASIPRKKRSLGDGCKASERKSEDSWFDQFRGREFVAGWLEKEPGFKQPIPQQEEDKLMNEREAETLAKNGSRKRFFVGEKGEKEMVKAKKRKVINNKTINFDRVPKELPTDLRKTIVEDKGGSEPVLVITKVLSATDTSTHHGRLSIPGNQVRSNFLTDEQKAKIRKPGGIGVGLIEPCGEENNSIRLSSWDMKNNTIYNLIRGWNSVVNNEKNELKGMGGQAVVQLWSFNCNTDLWFVLVKVPNEDQDDNGAVQGNGC